jgi:hypothetical protein
MESQPECRNQGMQHNSISEDLTQTVGYLFLHWNISSFLLHNVNTYFTQDTRFSKTTEKNTNIDWSSIFLMLLIILIIFLHYYLSLGSRTEAFTDTTASTIIVFLVSHSLIQVVGSISFKYKIKLSKMGLTLR